jgi:hypothetical protein
MERKEYNGWTNYETWLVNLWITNDEGIYQSTLDMVADNSADHDAADAIKNFVEELNPLNNTEASLYTDLVNAAISEVNWHEIAQTLREVVKYEARHEGAV